MSTQGVYTEWVIINSIKKLMHEKRINNEKLSFMTGISKSRIDRVLNSDHKQPINVVDAETMLVEMGSSLGEV